MSRSLKSQVSAAALSAQAGLTPVVGEAAAARPVEGIVGQAGSPAALARMLDALAEMKSASVNGLLQQAVTALQADDFNTGGALAIRGLELDEQSGFGWYLLAIARERAGDFASSVRAYEKALMLLPDHAEVANDMGRLAYRMGMKETAEKLFGHFVAAHPENTEALNNMACAVRDQGRYAEAIDILRPALMAHPADAMLWNTLGSVLAEQGDPAASATFFDEALRLQPDFPKARYNRATARHLLSDAAGALEDCNAAMAAPMPADEQLMMRLARSTMHLSLGHVAQGWDDYEARRDPSFGDVTHFLVDRPMWTPESDLHGKSLLLIGEQGLGDELLFANAIPDVLEALGPDGRLTLSLEPRLIPLFARSFPRARVGAHATFSVDGRTVRVVPFLEPEDLAAIDLWAPLASPLRRFRSSAEAFPARAGYLTADPARVAHWRSVLETAPAGPKVGLLWKSMTSKGARHRYFSPFEQWEPVLRVPGVTLVNLQYGDCEAELAAARAEGIDIWVPPGIDLKQDLDDVAALTCALDLTLGFSNATLNLAGACGAPVWLITPKAGWTMLGTDAYPWYPQARVFNPPAYGEWGAVMEEIAGALASAFGAEHKQT
ncbi:tetratricopeptide repeat protein [Caulobacter sp. SLTY]|uniref:tetratricopeptide repeat protein n=1 Tax=Caulobacter sp. SLTY TaxID=2683262 RepID=UPI0014125223|nr:tetratricopeptide repeat protein [Caulobacter sp. SLTY]NBB15878.1 tetratricopeptide repeat protein [Caulobacter sp. SLTY]